jgi:uncharacterized protein YlzI (FlbEa/FlbD family)
MIKLTDLAGNAIYFNPATIAVVREVLRSETSSNAGSAIETECGTLFVQERVDVVIQKLG